MTWYAPDCMRTRNQPLLAKNTPHNIKALVLQTEPIEKSIILFLMGIEWFGLFMRLQLIACR